MSNEKIALDYMVLLVCQLKQNCLSDNEIKNHLENIENLLGGVITPWPDDFQALLKEAPDLNEIFVIKQR